MTEPAHPTILWAQRRNIHDKTKNVIFVTVNLPDINSCNYDLTSNELSFTADAGPDKKKYAFKIEFYGEIESEVISKTSTSRSFCLELQKKKAGTWPQLIKGGTKNIHIKCDFDKWRDEDDEDGSPVDDNPDFDMPSGMGSDFDLERMMAAMPKDGPGGLGESSTAHAQDEDNLSDDEGPPPLEEPVPST